MRSTSAKIRRKTPPQGTAKTAKVGRPEQKRSGPPLYLQLVQTLRTEIINGVYPVGSRLPTEGELTARFGVSRHTVREALRELRDANLVSSRQGAGTIVLKPGAPQPYVHEVGSINDLIDYASQSDFKVETSNMITADAGLVAKIGGKIGQKWLLIEGYRYPTGETAPVCRTVVYVNSDFAGVARQIGRRPGPIYLWIEDLYGESIAEVEQSISAREVPPEIAPSLGIESGDLVIEVDRVYKLAKGDIAQVAINLYRADLFRHTITLRRAKS